ncbi:MAG TPA: tetratricopeptide repeat-containing diguanylate cyclase, partial [Burkholderiaceae bacterium]|nr:tetratricopeptide repeat-containing diguanylate cyclase [Burkholderiaceae bacterium]
RTMATGLFNIAATYEQKKDYERALDFYARTMEIEAQLDLPLERAYTQRARAATLVKMNRAQEALPLLDEALGVFERLDDADRAAQTRATRGKALRLLGRTREALVDLSRARAHFEQQSDPAFLEQIHEQRALALEAIGDWRGAAQARAMQAELVRTVAERVKAQQLARLQVQFDTARKDEENAALFAENTLRKQALEDAASIQRLQWLLIAVGGVAFIALGVMTWRQVHLSRRMRDLALSDELTRLPNRRNLLAQAQLRMDQAEDDKLALSVLAIDIDHFKRINDLYGHEAGDLVLRRVAQACTSAMRSNDVIGRVGGEEFVAILAEADREVARAVGERMRAAVQALRFPDIAADLGVTISLGLAERAEHEHLFSALAARADAALYRAKQAGRNRLED